MIAVNHALTGALIGLTVDNPAVALPLAFGSHFVCDIVPHYGHGDSDSYIGSKKFARQLLIDAGLCFALVVVLLVASPRHWLQAAVAAFLATSPDFAWLPGFIRTRQGGHFKKPNRGWFMQFASRIQWFERPIGAYIEAAWLIGAVTLLVAYL